MKKVVLALIIIFVVGGSIYTVNNYGNSILNSENNPTQNNLVIGQNSTTATESKLLTSASGINIYSFNSKAIDFKLTDLNSKTISLSDLKGKEYF